MLDWSALWLLSNAPFHERKTFSFPFCCPKIRAAVKLFENSDKTRSAIRNFKEKAVQTRCHSIIKDAEKCASGLKSTLTLQHPNPRATTEDGDEIGGKKFQTTLATAQQKAYCDTLGEEKWQGKLTKNRWEDSALDSGGCFAWMYSWRSVPTHTIAAKQELYQQMLPTKLYHQQKTGKGSGNTNVMCRMCGKSPESVPHVLAGCGILAQTNYLARHNAALKILFFEMLKDLELISEVSPWHSKTQPNRCMRMGVRKHYGMYRLMQTALRWRPRELQPE